MVKSMLEELNSDPSDYVAYINMMNEHVRGAHAAGAMPARRPAASASRVYAPPSSSRRGGSGVGGARSASARFSRSSVFQK